MPENAISRASGEKSGDSGASIVVSGMHLDLLRYHVLTISDRSFSVRTSGEAITLGDHDTAPSSSARRAWPVLEAHAWSKPLVRGG
jgi:hypothetical protein